NSPSKPVNPQGENKVLKAATYDEDTKDPYFIKFYAPWCGHCKNLAPIWEEFAYDMRGKANVGEVDCTTEGRVCQKLGIRGYPSLKYVTELGAIDFSGRRTVEGLTGFIEKFNEPVVTVVKSKEIKSLMKAKDVVFIYVYDSASLSDAHLTNFLKVAASVQTLTPIYITPDYEAAKKLFRIPDDHQNELPLLVVSKDGGMDQKVYNPPLTPLAETKQQQSLRTWILDNKHPLVPALTDANSREIMGTHGSDKLVVLGIFNGNDSPQIDRLRLAARAWGTSKYSTNSKKNVVFTWIDGKEKAEYISRAYGIKSVDELPKVVVLDPKEEELYRKDGAGADLELEKDALVENIHKMVEGKLKGTHINGMVGAFAKKFEKVMKPVVEFIVMYPYAVAIGGVAVVVALLYFLLSDEPPASKEERVPLKKAASVNKID
ncbi:hypothetical protein HDU99_009267, partial [Rhizoclosmatium hyalinum]